METIKDFTYLRATEINTYLECPAKLFFQSIEKIIVPNKIALAGGSAVHSALSFNYKQKIESRTDIPLSDFIDSFSDSYNSEIENVDKVDFDYERPEKVKDSWIEVLNIYYKDIISRIQPVRVEQKIRVKLKNFIYGLMGTPDAYDEFATVIDHKTTSKPYKETPENYKLQVGGAYVVLEQALAQTNPEIKPPQKARIDYLIRRSPKSPVPSIRNIAVPIDTEYFLSTFNEVSKGIKGDVFPPNRSHIYCTKRFCKFWNECQKKYGGKVRE
jgi:hypothetical protein